MRNRTSGRKRGDADPADRYKKSTFLPNIFQPRGRSPFITACRFFLCYNAYDDPMPYIFIQISFSLRDNSDMPISIIKDIGHFFFRIRYLMIKLFQATSRNDSSH
jgi:hypothetical protein